MIYLIIVCTINFILVSALVYWEWVKYISKVRAWKEYNNDKEPEEDYKITTEKLAHLFNQ